MTVARLENGLANEIGMDSTIVEGDLFSLPFADASFDVVISQGVLHHTSDPWRGFAELVRVCKPGGFIDIAQNARKVVFCGTLSAKGVKLQTGDGTMRVLQQGQVKKLVQKVDQITFSGPQSLVRHQTVLYLTERANFRLTPQGVELFEIAPGIDMQRDVLDQMEFRPRIAPDVQVMSSSFFCV